MGLKVGGTKDHPHWPKMGPSFMIATRLIFAIRTAKWPPNFDSSFSEASLDQEIGYAAHLARRVLMSLMSKNEAIFPSAKKPWYKPDEEDVPK
jgi:hypothetical protein